MEREKRPTTAEKVLIDGFAGQMIIVGIALVAGKIGLDDHARNVLATVLTDIHLGLDLLIVGGMVGIQVEGYRGKENILFKHKKPDSSKP